MRSGRSIAAVIGVAAVGFMMTGCSLPGSSTSVGGPASSPASAPSAAATAPQVAGGVAKCQPGVLRVGFGGHSGSTQRVQTIQLWNTGPTACTMAGFPGVDLVGYTDSFPNYRWPLTRQAMSYSKVTVQPGDAAHFTITYVPEPMGSGDNLAVETLVITPPNAFSHMQVPWKASLLIFNDPADAGTYISPIETGAGPM